MALPAIMIEREATLGVPTGTSSLSPSTSRTALGSMPSRPATSGTKVDRCPCPIACTPVRNATVPSVLEAQVDGLFEDAARNFQEAADADAAQLALRSEAARRAGKVAHSASASALSRRAAKSPLS